MLYAEDGGFVDNLVAFAIAEEETIFLRVNAGLCPGGRQGRVQAWFLLRRMQDSECIASVGPDQQQRILPAGNAG